MSRGRPRARRGQFTGADPPGAADAQRAQEGRQGALRIRPRRHRGRAGAARRGDPRVAACLRARLRGRIEAHPHRRHGAARAPTSARWAKTSARHWAAAPTWPACAARHRRLHRDAVRHARSARSHGRGRTPGPPAARRALVADHTRVTLGAEDAGRFLSGLRRRGAWPDAPAVAVFGDEPATPSSAPPT